MPGSNKPRAMEETGRADDARLFSPSAARNRDPLLEVLQQVLPPKGRLLEIASGTGEHAVHVCTALPQITWQPSELAAEALKSIAAWQAATGLANLKSPLRLDVTSPHWWREAEGPFDTVLSLNMIHIAPWEAAVGLIEGAGQVLSPGGALVLYGPFSKGGIHTAPSNEEFDTSLKSRDRRWGVRDLGDVSSLAAQSGLDFGQEVAMPANNLTLVFRKASK